MLAGAMAVSTPDEIKRSAYTATVASPKPLTSVNGCIKEALQSALNGSRPAAVTYRDTGATPYQYQVGNGVGSSWSGARPELLALVEAWPSPSGATSVQVWAHPSLLSNGGSRGYLDRTMALIRPCI